MLEYSGRILDLVEVLDPVRYEQYRTDISASPVPDEYSGENKFWMSKGAFNKISEFFNDIYLKFNGQDLGTGSYNDGNFWEVTPSDPDDDGNITYEIVLSDIQLVFLTRYGTKN